MPDQRYTLRIDDLTVSYREGSRWLEAVRDFVMEIAPGQVYGLVGESGSGKSTVALAVMQYLSKDGRIDAGTILFEDRDLLQMSTADMRNVWGKQLALVPQDPLSSLNPSVRVGEQIAEILRQHSGLGRREANQQAIEHLRMVQVPDPERVARSYPHEISGGMQQRVLIAMALCTEPRLLILDEPTTGLDVTTQAAVLDLFKNLIEARQTAALYVTHNLGVVARVCDRVAVLYAGELVEDAPVEQLFMKPLHPYTLGLLESVPQVSESQRTVELKAIPGHIPALDERPEGCVFAPRCSLAIDECRVQRPILENASSVWKVRCIRWQEIAGNKITTEDLPRARKELRAAKALEQVLRIDNLRVQFSADRSLVDVVSRQPARVIRAVDGVNFELQKGQTLGIVGESGSGKTTLARAVVGLAGRTEGDIELLGLSLPPKLSERSLAMCRMLQYVFQNPEEALNPYMTVGQTLARPFMTLLKLSSSEAEHEVVKLLQAVSLPASYAGRLPSQLSGGEKQRVAIARAFATRPDLLIADEPVSALDVSVQASILNLLSDLQVENRNTLIFISHDLAVVAYLADHVAVMYAGQFMELAEADSLFRPPYHPYTEALLSAIPSLDPGLKQAPIRLQGEVPSQMNSPGGCPFHPRCPRCLGDICETETPPWQETSEGERIFCHIPLEELRDAQAPHETDAEVAV